MPGCGPRRLIRLGDNDRRESRWHRLNTHAGRAMWQCPA